MLSPPSPRVNLKSGETQASRRASKTRTMLCGSACDGAPPRPSRTKSTTSWLLLTSQTPSQQITTNSSCSVRLKNSTSGVEHMICSSGLRVPSFLYSRSPSARERLRLPLTRCWPGAVCSTYPPAASILCFSLGSFGLWSWLRATARPPRQRTARLSPAFATMNWSSVTQQTQAVQPTRSTSTEWEGGTLPAASGAGLFVRACSSGLLAPSRRSSSMRWKEPTRAARRSPAALGRSRGKLQSSSGKCRAENLATCSPPWPSRTPNSPTVPQHPSAGSDGRQM
mmetsp:Transcript_58572/g.171406  ORF Transcript_58572/g.171406 Transcript_58572/m.171406 type:complete len:282 (-) Transcript_58572:203-1048(-)